MISIVFIYLLNLTKDFTKTIYHHGEAGCRIPWHGYAIFSHPLAVTSLQWTGQGRCWRILLNYVNQLRKKLISTLIYFISFFNLLPTWLPWNRSDRAPLTSPSGCASFMIPPPLGMHVFGWLLCKIVVRRPPKTTIWFIFLIFCRIIRHPKRREIVTP